MLEARFPEIYETQPELLAHHYTGPDCPSRLFLIGSGPASLAGERSAPPEAMAHLRGGLEIPATLPDTPERAWQEPSW